MTHEIYMRRAVELAKRGGKATKSNPNVGAVIVHHHRIIGEGYHRYYGGPHAEVEAIASIKQEDIPLLPQSSIYITLEPCNHYGKTPPCSRLIIDKRIQEVYVGCLDPSVEMSGKSIALLEAAGCKVTVGVLAEACESLIRPFVVHKGERPYIILKQAVSQDGYIGKEGEQVWLTGAISKAVSHEWRSHVDGILVGTTTVVTDNPSLTTRQVDGDSPLRIILDRKGRIPSSHRIFTDGGETLVITSLHDYPSCKRYITLREWSLTKILDAVWAADVRYLLVEGGASIIKAFYAEGLWDEALHFKSPIQLQDGVKSVNITGRLINTYVLGEDTLQHIAKG